MKITSYIALSLAILLASGCSKYAEDYKGYLDKKEKTYPGLAGKFGYNTGDHRVQLYWQPSPDPSITKYVVSWNNRTDSVTVNATTTDPGDTIKVVVPNLSEYVYSFKLVAYDAAGNSSIGQELNNVRVYGDVYKSGLFNRAYAAAAYDYTDDGKLRLNFKKADSGNVGTEISYTNTLGLNEKRIIGADTSSIIIPDHKPRTGIQYRAMYKPTKTAIDNFAVPYEDYPTVYPWRESNKGLFNTYSLPTDIGSAYGWELRYLWDNNYNEPGFHTPGQNMPFWFTIDLGAKVSLAKMKSWQRMSGLFNYGNLKRFEVWGTNEPNANGDWNGWTRLASFTSVKPSGLPRGQNTAEDEALARAGEPFVFPTNTMEVRYIRIKMLEVWDGNYFHAIEFTFLQADK